MMRFYIGQVVKLRVGDQDLGIIITECKEPEGYWSVALRTKLGDRTKIMHIKEVDLEAYKRHCWNCHIDLNSDDHPTCQRCGWIKCPNCGKCEKDICGSNSLLIFKEPGYRLLTPDKLKFYVYYGNGNVEYEL